MRKCLKRILFAGMAALVILAWFVPSGMAQRVTIPRGDFSRQWVIHKEYTDDRMREQKARGWTYDPLSAVEPNKLDNENGRRNTAEANSQILLINKMGDEAESFHRLFVERNTLFEASGIPWPEWQKQIDLERENLQKCGNTTCDNSDKGKKDKKEKPRKDSKKKMPKKKDVSNGHASAGSNTTTGTGNNESGVGGNPNPLGVGGGVGGTTWVCSVTQGGGTVSALTAAPQGAGMGSGLSADGGNPAPQPTFRTKDECVELCKKTPGTGKTCSEQTKKPGE